MALVIAPPPDYQLVSAATPSALVQRLVDRDPATPLDEAEEVMDYTPVGAGQLAAPTFAEEAWSEDGNGPMGY